MAVVEEANPASYVGLDVVAWRAAESVDRILSRERFLSSMDRAVDTRTNGFPSARPYGAGPIGKVIASLSFDREGIATSSTNWMHGWHQLLRGALRKLIAVVS